MDQYAENYISENSALRRKLQSKAEALLILSQELEQCRMERDQFKMMAEQVQDRYTSLKKMSPDVLKYDRGSSSRLYLGGRTVFQVFEELKEQNKILQLEVEDLKQKLRDAQGDMKALRAGMNQQRGGGDGGTVPDHQREELVQQLEAISAQCAQLQSDTQALLDEKEELIMQRDAYKCKIHRMNHQLGVILHANPSQVFDIDALVSENKYLHEHLEQLKEENELSQQALLKYKVSGTIIIRNQNLFEYSTSSMLDKKRNKGSVRLGTNSNGNSSGMVVSHKQVQQLLEYGSSNQLPNTEATLADLRSLCLALLEALQDKSLALSHQKKSNKILANRVCDLEKRLASVENGIPLYPSQILLNGYSSSNVDKDLQSNDLHISDICVNNPCSDNLDTTGDLEIYKNNVRFKGNDQKYIDNLSVKLKNDKSYKLNQNSSPVLCTTVLNNDSENSDISSAVSNLTTGSDELSVDVLPPQLQELVLSALEDIENNKRVKS